MVFYWLLVYYSPYWSLWICLKLSISAIVQMLLLFQALVLIYEVSFRKWVSSSIGILLLLVINLWLSLPIKGSPVPPCVQMRLKYAFILFFLDEVVCIYSSNLSKRISYFSLHPGNISVSLIIHMATIQVCLSKNLHILWQRIQDYL